MTSAPFRLSTDEQQTLTVEPSGKGDGTYLLKIDGEVTPFWTVDGVRSVRRLHAGIDSLTVFTMNIVVPGTFDLDSVPESIPVLPPQQS